jgi:LPXTG-motif cell wall-anchored protein
VRATLTRRLLAGTAALVVGLTGALALSAPAQAVVERPMWIDNFDVCDGTYLEFDPDFVAEVEVDGEVFWPGADVLRVEKTGEVLIFVPDYETIVAKPDDDLPFWTHTFTEPRVCADLTEPTLTPATCEAPATIAIPEEVNIEQELPELYTLNGELVDPESTHTVEPGTHTVQIVWRIDDPQIELQLKTWTFVVEAPDCPEETETETTETGGEELAATGSPTLWIAGIAVALLVVGGGLFFLTRRRNVDFTA